MPVFFLCNLSPLLTANSNVVTAKSLRAHSYSGYNCPHLLLHQSRLLTFVELGQSLLGLQLLPVVILLLNLGLALLPEPIGQLRDPLLQLRGPLCEALPVRALTVQLEDGKRGGGGRQMVESDRTRDILGEYVCA